VPVSRSTLSAQVAEWKREMVGKLDHEARLSRSRLVGKVRLWLGKIDQIVLDQKSHPVTLRPQRSKLLMVHEKVDLLWIRNNPIVTLRSG